MKNKFTALILMMFSLLTGGCGTVQCLNSSGHYNPVFQQKTPPANAVYGGVRWDLKDNPSDIAFWNFMNDVQRYADLPFSFIADTIILPYTLFSKPKPVYSLPESGNLVLKAPKMPQYKISINEMEPKKTNNLSGSFRGPKPTIHSLMQSNVIRKIEMVPRDKEGYFYDLKLYLDRPGRLLWAKLSSDYKDKSLGLLVDGMFYRSFSPKPVIDNKFTLIDGPFDKFTAKYLKESAPKNYAFYNQDSKQKEKGSPETYSSDDK